MKLIIIAETMLSNFLLPLTERRIRSRHSSRMGVDILRDIDAARSHGVRVVQSGEYEHIEKTVRETAGDGLLEGSEFPEQLEEQTSPAQIGKIR